MIEIKQVLGLPSQGTAVREIGRRMYKQRLKAFDERRWIALPQGLAADICIPSLKSIDAGTDQCAAGRGFCDGAHSAPCYHVALTSRLFPCHHKPEESAVGVTTNHMVMSW